MVTPRQKIVMICEHIPDAKPNENLASEAIVFDDIKVTIVGFPDAVRDMETWIQAALRKEDYKEILRYHLLPTKPGHPLQFPLISEELWNITVK